MKCAACWDRDGQLFVIGYETANKLCGECLRARYFRLKLALHQISNRPCECALPGCVHAVAEDALRDR